MGSVGVVILDVRRQNAFQMVLTQHDHMIRTLAPDRSDNPFNERILPWTPQCGDDFLDAHAFHAIPKGFPVDPIPIPHQILRGRVPREGFHNLLGRPFRRRIRGHIEMHDSPPVVAEDYQDEQDIECRGRNREKVHGAFFHMVVQEGPPGLGRRFLVRFSLRHQAGNRSLGNFESQLDQLTVNPGCAPGRIGQSHRFHLISDFRINFWSSRNLGFEFPEKLEALAMPADHGVRRNDDKDITPSGPYPGEDDPE